MAPTRKTTKKKTAVTTDKGGIDRPKPIVKPGQQLGYVDKLKANGLWPLRRRKTPAGGGNEKRPTITPFLVVPATPPDDGSRPIPDQQALFNQSVMILDGAGHPVLTPLAGSTYHLQCRVTNRGACGAFGGIAEFYIGGSSTFDTAAATPHAHMGAKGYAGFNAGPGSTVLVTCPNAWTPATQTEAASSIVVQAYDAFVDRVQHAFDGRHDRHVGRRDFIPDFSGTWDGMESSNVIHQSPTLIRIHIDQNYLLANASFYMQVGGALPSAPQETGQATVFNHQLQLQITESLGGQPFTVNNWTLSLTASGLLHFEHEMKFVAPGDTRPTTHTTGDLHRI